MDADGSSSGNPLMYILLLLILIGINAFFALSEMAVVSVNDNKINKLAEDGDKKAKKLVRLLASPTNFLSTIQIGVTLSGFLASAIAADTFADMIVGAIGGSITFISVSALRTISIIIITFILSYFTLVLGELVPKRIAMQNPERIAFSIVGMLTFLTGALKPFVSLLSASTNGILRLLGIDPKQVPDDITEEEIRLMLDVGNERGNIEESEKHMIHNIFEFDDRNVDEIMTHRTEIVAADYGSTLEELLEMAVSNGYSRIPIYSGELDNIRGMLYVKDLLTFATEKKQEFDMESHLRSPLFVIESTSCKDLLTQFKETKVQLAIVVDEYGGTAGLVTMEDLLEAIVGNIQDEYDDEEEEIQPLDDTHYLIDGLTDIETVGEYFHLAVLEEDDDFDTIGGYVLSKIGQIPGPGETPSVIVENLLFTVNEMNERRIAKLMVEFLPTEADEDSDDHNDREKSSKKDKGKDY